MLEIDRKLRDDFRRRVKDFGVSTDATDPLLNVLFRTVAQQIGQVYGDAAQLRQSLLRELMNGLEVERFLARPAQAVVRLINDLPEPRMLREGTELNATTSSGERLLFGLDATLEVSQARIALALSYQNQHVRLLSGVELSEDLQALRPSLDPVPVALGEQPALFLAIENLSPQLLNRHGIFFELSPGAYAIQHALNREPWWIFGAEGELSGQGLLRCSAKTGGVSQLEFQLKTNRAQAQTHSEEAHTLPMIAAGFHSERQFLFPPMSAEDKLLCRIPRLLSAPLSTIVDRGLPEWLDTPRLWIKISMPPSIPQLHHAINNILLHTMTASNLFVRNQTVHFQRDGLSFPVIKASGTPEHLVAPLSIHSETNDSYQAGTRLGATANGGWFEQHNNRLTLHPGTSADGVPHTSANIRLWLTNGVLGNRVGPGNLAGFSNAAALQGMRVVQVTSAAGGSNGEEMASEERRFADALLTRGRIVTEPDLQAAALAIDRRVLAAQVTSGVERGPQGLQHVLRLLLTIDSQAFSKPEIELPSLKAQLEADLRKRLVHGLVLEVDFQWN